MVLIGLLYSYTCYWYRPEKLIHYEYTIQISSVSSQNETFCVYVPLLISKDGLPSKRNHLFNFIEGKGVFEINQTEKGFALSIVTNSSISLKLNVKYSTSKGDGYNEGPFLSMKENTTYPMSWNEYEKNKNHWIFYNGTNNNDLALSLDYNIHGYDYGKHITMNKKISGGWNLCNVTTSGAWA